LKGKNNKSYQDKRQEQQSYEKQQQRNSFRFTQVVSLLDLVRNSIKRVPEAAALFYDELANVVEKRQLDPKTEVNCMMVRW
jgi:hypothetical protein